GGIYVPLYSAWNLAVMGRTDAAEEEVLREAARSADPQAPPLIDIFRMASAHVRRDVSTAREHAERAIAISGEQRFYLLLAVAFCGHGLSLVHDGRHAEGIGEIQQGLAIMRAGGSMSTVGYYLTYLAEAHLAADAIPDGLAAVAEGRELCARDLARVHEPELLRLEGELLRRAGDDAAAEDRFRRALALARAREARAWELRAAVSL